MQFDEIEDRDDIWQRFNTIIEDDPPTNLQHFAKKEIGVSYSTLEKYMNRPNYRHVMHYSTFRKIVEWVKKKEESNEI